MPVNVIDSHVHLYSKSYSQDGRLPLVSQSSQLNDEFRLDEYKKVISESSKHKVEGLIFIEICVDSGLSYEGWKYPIEEYLYVERIILGIPKIGEGSDLSGKDFIKGIVPWAPIPQGVTKLKEYIQKLKTQSLDPKTFERVKGFRYLFDGLPPGSILEQNYIDSINWLAQNGFVYDLGLNIRQDGNRQLKEVIELLQKTENVTYILNHLSKANLSLSSKDVYNNLDFKEWQSLVERISQNTQSNKIYIKFSGGFPELPDEIAQDDDLTESIARIEPWFKTFVDNFPKNQIIFGSDWPIAVKKINFHETWVKWVKITDYLIDKYGLNPEDFYKNNVVEAYNLN
ncbi:hypothetical protein BN7_5108 [Wickerhamomyces ciferrii]|uniref:Amidohydrolase-related domain-containing protein n=1 Tax=Wickerhamomyces ciferrii (strain ATCC 14091 / BCRC 22168 / CBS 111 / JCM 3599 / NBRC 0793 / NRRL Y-1031 F-60-10) TaxID=1206466 RepID=K0KQY6_WICCF|nr:uncharacterized protein BN7_5108 [Wickerhamomyces ciferrii]CCH45526.1 hypothetical protein BN7_5108 [Wickerhamomyces ciferrii]